MKVLYSNKKARFDFDISDTFEAGIVLEGWEVKSAKAGNLSLKGSFIKEKEDELFLKGARISSWQYGQEKDQNQIYRDRKLLLKRRQIKNLLSKAQEKGFAIVPLDMYSNNGGMIKVTVGLGKGRKKFDKRSELKKRDLDRRVQTDRKTYNL